MKISTFIIKIWRWGSIFFAVAALGWTYSTFSDMVGFNFDGNGKPSEYLPKSTVFYIAMALILINNVLISSVAKQVKRIPVSMLLIPKSEAWEKNKPALYEILTNWIYSLIAAINTILGFSLFALSTVNSESKFDIFDFSWLSYFSIILLTIIMLAPPLILMRPPAPEEDEKF